MAGGIFSQLWNAGLVRVLGANLTLLNGTLTATGGGGQWNAGTVTAIGPGLVLSGGTLDVASAPVVTAWNPADNSNLTLSNGNLTASAQTTASTWRAIRSTTSRSSGKLYLEFTADHIDGSNGFCIGFGTSAMSLTGQVGGDSHGIGAQSTGDYYYNGVQHTATAPSMATGAVIAVAIDLTGSNINVWWKNLTTVSFWNNDAASDPATGLVPRAGPLVSSGPFFIAFSGYFGGSADTATINTTTSFVGTIPSGFTAWG